MKIISLEIKDYQPIKNLPDSFSAEDKKDNIIFVNEKNIVKYLLMTDMLISDTSSVIYEFILFFYLFLLSQ